MTDDFEKAQRRAARDELNASLERSDKRWTRAERVLQWLIVAFIVVTFLREPLHEWINYWQAPMPAWQIYMWLGFVYLLCRRR